MEDVLNFLANCRMRLATSQFFGLKKDAPTPKSKIVDEIFHLFLTGYNAALETDAEGLAKYLAGVDYIDRSVMLEGSYAAVASRDIKSGGNWTNLLELMAVASDNIVAINEGIGHALCQQRQTIDFNPNVTGTFWGWLAVDGYGCHAGYFRWPSVIGRQEIPVGLDELGLRAFDQGLGRAVWLISAANPKLIGQTLDKFPHSRRADLWSGVGMMSGFWGADDATDMKRLLRASGKWRPWLQCGVAWSAKGRFDAKDVRDFTTDACSVICHSDTREMTSLADRCLSESQTIVEGSRQFSQWKQLMAQEFLN